MSERTFEITRRYFGDPVSGKFTLPDSNPKLRGIPLGPHATLDETFDLADPGKFIGFLTRDVTTDGATITELHLPTDDLELPYKSGGEVAVEKADEFEAEGTDFLVLSGTGAISNATAVGTLIEPSAGKWRVAQNPEDGVYRIVKANLPAVDATNTFRIRAEITR